MARRSKQRRQEEEELQLYDVLEPYDDRAYHYNGDPMIDDQDAYYDPQGDYYDQPDMDYEPQAYGQYPEAGYADYLEEPEAYDEPDHHIGVAVHVADVVSALAGVLVILILVAMLLTLVDWLRTDIMHSFVLLQSGIS